MRKIYSLIVFLSGFITVNELDARLPGHLFISVQAGYSMPGFKSEGTGFIGRNLAISAAYNPFPERKVSLNVAAGFAINAYRHYFDETVFVAHIQKGLNTEVNASLVAGERCRVITGFSVYLPWRTMVDIGQKQNNATYFFSNDSVMFRYEMNTIQAAAVIGIDWRLGKNKQLIFGIRVIQAANSPVKKNAEYRDGLGNEVIIDRRMKPLTANIRVAHRILPREKRKEKLFERVD